MTLGFSARLIWYLHWILLWYVHHWNEYDIFLWTLVLLCLDSYLPYHHSIILFLTEDRGSLTWRLCRRRWHNDNLRCHWWWQASRSFLRVAQNKVFKCFIYVLNPNNLYNYFKLLHVTYLFIIYYPFTYLFFCIFTAVCLILYNWIITCFYCTLIICMLLSATSTHFKWELMLHCFTLSDFK